MSKSENTVPSTPTPVPPEEANEARDELAGPPRVIRLPSSGIPELSPSSILTACCWIGTAFWNRRGDDEALRGLSAGPEPTEEPPPKALWVWNEEERLAEESGAGERASSNTSKSPGLRREVGMGNPGRKENHRLCR